MLGYSFNLSPTELFNILVWYVEYHDVPRCVDNDSEVFVLKSLSHFHV